MNRKTWLAHNRPRIVLLLLGVAALLWLLALLFLLRVVNIFDRVLMKRLGPLVLYALMSAGPLLAAVLGQQMVRAGQRVWLGRFATGMGSVLFVAFVVVVGRPLLSNALAPDTPINPSTPRALGPQTGLPVFPGAEGFGAHTPAGRGGRVIAVTSLDDHGPGSLRAALETPDPRIVVFRVGGTITLEEPLFIAEPYVTVAGQTAPGDGVLLKDAGLVITTHDVLVQHLRIRPGNQGDVTPEDNDAVAIFGPHGEVGGAYNVVLDHISAGWGEDETISTWYGAHDITISWSIVGEALNRSRHRKETHSAGLLLGDSSYNVSLHHNLLAHNDFRNPLIIGGGTHDVVNNVIYNWGILAAEIVDFHSNSFLNFVGNVFRAGPATVPGNYEILIAPEEGLPRLYVEENVGPHRPGPGVDAWALVGHGYGDNGVAPPAYRSPRPFPAPAVTVLDATEALEAVLAGAGASRPRRDPVDRRLVSDVRRGTGAIIDDPDQVGGYPAMSGGPDPPDGDGDGMPDAWERARGLDPSNAADGAGDRDDDGYTNVEEYLFTLAAP